jgi:hypothetical protein
VRLNRVYRDSKRHIIAKIAVSACCGPIPMIGNKNITSRGRKHAPSAFGQLGASRRKNCGANKVRIMSLGRSEFEPSRLVLQHRWLSLLFDNILLIDSGVAQLIRLSLSKLRRGIELSLFCYSSSVTPTTILTLLTGNCRTRPSSVAIFTSGNSNNWATFNTLSLSIAIVPCRPVSHQICTSLP